MTHRDYAQMAKLVSRLPDKMTKEALVQGLCLLFALDNGRFNEARFIAACSKGEDK